MVVAQLKLVVVASWLTLGTLLLVGACSGAEFEADAGGGVAGQVGMAGTNSGGAQSGGGQSGAGRSGSGGGAPRPNCASLADCDDGDACTTDFCTIEGKCEIAPKCSGTERCCDGDCAGCCEDSDCDDGIACTTNTCFAGQCMYIPDDGKCGPGQACSVTESCQDKQMCGPDVAGVSCEDSSLCTIDSCENGFCKNEFCTAGTLCCASGCAEECCSDAQCDTDADPCTVGSCQGGKCTVTPLCGAADKCCPSADGTSASCGSCCSAMECDDGVACTQDSCTGARLGCSNNPDNATCGKGEFCDPIKGCQTQVQCQTAGDCKAGNCGRCEAGICKYDCPNGQPCCAASNTCAVCCGDASCSDGVDCTVDKCTAQSCTHTPDASICGFGYQCDAELGCVQCTKDAHCDDGNACTTDSCDVNRNLCLHVSTCECKTGFDCLNKVNATKAIGPIGTQCHACVDGACKMVSCSGSCCSSGCYPGDLCPD
jgi:hypothetical protein